MYYRSGLANARLVRGCSGQQPIRLHGEPICPASPSLHDVQPAANPQAIAAPTSPQPISSTACRFMSELLPVSRTPGLGVLMRTESANGTTII